MKKYIKSLLFIFTFFLLSESLSAGFFTKVKDLIVGDNFRTVSEGRCYRAKQLSASHLDYYLKKYNIKYILNLCSESECKNPWYQKELQVAQNNGVKIINIPFHKKDMPTKYSLHELISAYRTHSNDPILIHCFWGTDRTGLAAFLWKFLIEGKSKEEAYNEELNRWIFPPWWTHYEWNRPNMDKFVRICPSNRDEFDEWIASSYQF